MPHVFGPGLNSIAKALLLTALLLSAGRHSSAQKRVPECALLYHSYSWLLPDLDNSSMGAESMVCSTGPNPGAKITATYKVMPTLPDLTEEDLQNLAVYVHSLTK